ncbi:MAG TPA: DUF2752 domain-containing protein [Blastocatellia bacterium]|nr:DUF2752 domain-containing protein [Blastocatellia bacterium]
MDRKEQTGLETAIHKDAPVVGGEPHSRRAAALTLVGLTLVFLVSILYRPADTDPNGPYFTICGFKNVTGLPCPGCGLTHSFCALGKGDLALAFAFNLLGPPLFLLLMLLWFRSACALANWRKPVLALDRLAKRVRPARTFVIAFFIYGAARIIYLLAARPDVVHNTPLARFIAWFGG